MILRVILIAFIKEKEICKNILDFYKSEANKFTRKKSKTTLLLLKLTILVLVSLVSYIKRGK